MTATADRSAAETPESRRAWEWDAQEGTGSWRLDLPGHMLGLWLGLCGCAEKRRAATYLVDSVVNGCTMSRLGELGHDTAPDLMNAGLGGEHVSKDRPVASHDCGAGVVTARLDTEHEPLRRVALWKDAHLLLFGEVRGPTERAG